MLEFGRWLGRTLTSILCFDRESRFLAVIRRVWAAFGLLISLTSSHSDTNLRRDKSLARCASTLSTSRFEPVQSLLNTHFQMSLNVESKQARFERRLMESDRYLWRSALERNCTLREHLLSQFHHRYTEQCRVAYQPKNLGRARLRVFRILKRCKAVVASEGAAPATGFGAPDCHLGSSCRTILRPIN